MKFRRQPAYNRGQYARRIFDALMIGDFDRREAAAKKALKAYVQRYGATGSKAHVNKINMSLRRNGERCRAINLIRSVLNGENAAHVGIQLPWLIPSQKRNAVERHWLEVRRQF